jgi:hypothetical protein
VAYCLVSSVLHRSARHSQVKLFVRSVWWWLGGDGRSGETFFNKRLWVLLWCGCCLLLFPPLLPVHGGVDRDGMSATSCSAGGDRGDLQKYELIHARGNLATMIWCRQSGTISTSDKDALRICCGSSTSHGHQLVCPRWHGNGRRQRTFAGRELTSYSLLFLGCNVWRTLAINDGDTRGLDCLNLYIFRVFVKICRALSPNSWFLKARDARALLQNLYLPILME